MRNNTLEGALKIGAANLLKKTTSPILDVEILLGFVIKKPLEFLLTYPEKKLTVAQWKKFKKLIAKRCAGWPIAYLTGHKEFYGLDFLVDKNILIPRPETELLVEEAIKIIGDNGQKITLIDVGTGSGCVPIAIGKKINTQIKIFATDISPKALAIARRNAQKNRVKISFIKNNLLDNLPLKTKTPLVFTANLPYLTAKQMKEKSIQREPRQALYGGKNGLEFYERLLKQIKELVQESFFILLEIDPAQATKITSLIKKYLPQSKAEILKDLSGRKRLVKIIWPKPLSK